MLIYRKRSDRKTIIIKPIPSSKHQREGEKKRKKKLNPIESNPMRFCCLDSKRKHKDYQRRAWYPHPHSGRPSNQSRDPTPQPQIRLHWTTWSPAWVGIRLPRWRRKAQLHQISPATTFPGGRRTSSRGEGSRSAPETTMAFRRKRVWGGVEDLPCTDRRLKRWGRPVRWGCNSSMSWFAMSRTGGSPACSNKRSCASSSLSL